MSSGNLMGDIKQNTAGFMGIVDATPYGMKNMLNSYWPSTTSEIKLITEEDFKYKIKRVENGFLLKIGNRELVFETFTKLASVLEAEMKSEGEK